MVVKRKVRKTRKTTATAVVRRVVLVEDLYLGNAKVATVAVHYLPDYPGADAWRPGAEEIFPQI